MSAILILSHSNQTRVKIKVRTVETLIFTRENNKQSQSPSISNGSRKMIKENINGSHILEWASLHQSFPLYPSGDSSTPFNWTTLEWFTWKNCNPSIKNQTVNESATYEEISRFFAKERKTHSEEHMKNSIETRGSLKWWTWLEAEKLPNYLKINQDPHGFVSL